MSEMNPMKKINDKLALLEAKVDSLTSMIANPLNSEHVQNILANQSSAFTDEQLALITNGIQNTLTQQLTAIINNIVNPPAPEPPIEP